MKSKAALISVLIICSFQSLFSAESLDGLTGNQRRALTSDRSRDVAWLVINESRSQDSDSSQLLVLLNYENIRRAINSGESFGAYLNDSSTNDRFIQFLRNARDYLNTHLQRNFSLRIFNYARSFQSSIAYFESLAKEKSAIYTFKKYEDRKDDRGDDDDESNNGDDADMGKLGGLLLLGLASLLKQ